jgi:3-oxoadipate enol-lactonase
MVWVEREGVMLNAEVSGKGPKSAILVHELGGTLHSFDAIVPMLEKTFRVLRYDQRGAGNSEKPPRGITIEKHVEDLKGLIDWAGLRQPYLVLGAAAGAVIALEYALSLESGAEQLVLCAPAIAMTPERREELLARARDVAESGMRAVAERVLERSFPPLLRKDAAVYETYRARFLANDPQLYATTADCMTGAKFEDRLSNLTVPSLVLAGAYDLVRPVGLVAASVEAIPNRRFRLIESGHLMAVQTPELVAAEIEAWIHDENIERERNNDGI